MASKSFIAFTLVSSVSGFSPLSSRAKTVADTKAVAIDSNGADQVQKSIFDPLGLYPENSKERRLGLIQSLEPSFEKDETVVDPLSLYQDESELTNGVEMSAALPFLKRPELLDASLPGDRGFDPFNFASDASALSWYRDSEIKHARLAMLATVGWPIAELAHKGLATKLDLDQTLAFHDKAPSVLNGGLSTTNPLFWVCAISAAAALEFVATKNSDDIKTSGDFGFDPLSLGGKTESDKFFMQEAEIFNGRLAMLAITGFVAQEFATNTAVVNETPIFFKPFGALVEQLLGSGGAVSI